MFDSDVIYSPSEVQQEFHLLNCREALYGGTAGCGKTVALLGDAFISQIYGENERYVEAKKKKQHFQSVGWAIYLRRTFPMLEQAITLFDRMARAFDRNVRYDGKTYTYTFSCGFRFQFGHMKDSDSWRMYDSNNYCVAKGTKIRMADGTLKKIEDVSVGDTVMTLEGGKRVSATHKTGEKICSEVVFRDPCGLTRRQIHPTTHPVLLSSSVESRCQRSPRARQTAQLSHSDEMIWQDYESLLCGRQESPVRRVSSIGREILTEESYGSPPIGERLPRLSVRLVLHEPETHRCERHAQTPRVCCGHRKESVSSTGLLQVPWQRLPGECSDLRPSGQASPPTPLSNGETCACGGACEPGESGTATDYLECCCACCHPRDGQPPTSVAVDQRTTQRPDGVAERTPKCSRLDGRGSTRRCMACTGETQLFYPHFYSGKLRAVRERVRIQDAYVGLHGLCETFDLTVEDANHYITEVGMVNANTAVYMDELIQFELCQYDGIRGRIRSGDPILRSKLRLRAATNPDAPPEGRWVKERFVDPATMGRTILEERVKLFDGSIEVQERIFIPAQLTDNPDAQFRRDYEISLRTQPWHVQQARLHGDWNVVEGAFFAHEWKPEFHVVKPFEIPKSWFIFRSMDWGYKAACVVLYWAVNNDGDLVCFKEVTFNHKVKEKDRKDAQLVAIAIREMEKTMGYWDKREDCSVLRGPADNQLWSKQGTVGPSMAESMFAEGVYWDKCVKNRTQAAAEFLRRLRDIPKRPGARPAITFFDTCRYIIETLPTLKVSETDQEVPAESSNDHWYDAICYAVMSRRAGQGLEDDSRKAHDEDEEDKMFDELEIRRQKKHSSGWAYGT